MIQGGFDAKSGIYTKNLLVKHYIFLFVAVTVNYILDLNVQWKVYQRLIKVIIFSLIAVAYSSSD